MVAQEIERLVLCDEKLLLLNSQGFIPGPSESESGFLERVRATKAIFEEEDSEKRVPRAHWDWVRSHVKEIFDFEPHCLPAFYSNHSLSPWQGAASWIESGRLVSVQLREQLKRGSYFGTSREEILAHESVHAARSAFDEPQGEEFFAYMTSEKWWRRALGPVVRNPWEVWVFFAAIVTGIFFPIGNFIAACLASSGALRLIRLHRKMSKAANALMTKVGDPKRARAILIRLTDSEIGLFAKKEDIFDYASRQRSLRWRLIRLAYLEACSLYLEK